jgi:hypothetical protein
MPTPNEPNPIATMREFKTLCFGLTRTTRFRITDQAIRYLRRSMVDTIASRERPPAALHVIFAALKKKCAQKPLKYKRGIADLGDLREWLAPDVPADAGEYDTAVAPGDTTQLYGIRRILERVRVDGETYFVVEWEPTREPKANLPKGMIAAFERHRRAIVERHFIEAEAVEDNSLNRTEG